LHAVADVPPAEPRHGSMAPWRHGRLTYRVLPGVFDSL
jgi:hypothetical protein